MAEEARRLDVPTSGVNALDEDCYANDGGVPSSSALGRQLARNDRALFAMLRRTLVAQGWSVQDPPQLCRYHGTRLGPWPIPTTPGVREAQWRVRVKPDANAVHTYIPWVDPWLPYGGNVDAASVVEHIDGGAGSEVTVGPLTMRVGFEADTPPMAGVIVRAHPYGSPTVGGANSVRTVTPTTIQAAAGSFAGFATPPCKIIQLYDRTNARVVMEWRDVLAVRQTAIAGDTAIFWPPWDPREFPWGVDVEWQHKDVYSADLYSAVLREVPLSGNLGAL